MAPCPLMHPFPALIWYFAIAASYDHSLLHLLCGGICGVWCQSWPTGKIPCINGIEPGVFDGAEIHSMEIRDVILYGFLLINSVLRL
jgi:hypothetical protein